MHLPLDTSTWEFPDEFNSQLSLDLFHKILAWMRSGCSVKEWLGHKGQFPMLGREAVGKPTKKGIKLIYMTREIL